jgi:MFS family permease
MMGAQLVTRVLYPRLGPRRIMMGGLGGVAIGLVAMSFVGGQTSLWLVRLAMLEMGISMSGVFVPTQAAAFSTISPADTGRASTFFNAQRQVGGAAGVAVLTTILSAVGVTSSIAGHATAHLTAYHLAFLTAAFLALFGVAAAATVKDVDAANTITGRRTVAVPAQETGDELTARATV